MTSFKGQEFALLGEALDVAEDSTGNFFKLSQGQWKRHFFEVRTGAAFRPGIFAVLDRIDGHGGGLGPAPRMPDFYRISLQDREIVKAVMRDGDLWFFPLLVYVFTHELVHIVRFGNFSQRFDVTEKERDKEERVVHAITHDILKDLPVPHLSYVLDVYQDLRFTDYWSCS
jgi:hypothetical protein